MINKLSTIIIKCSLLIFAVMFCFTGCSEPNTNQIGYGNDYKLPIWYSANSGKTKFKLNEVTLDFYYGRINGSQFGGGEFWSYDDKENYEFICFALYLYNSKSEELKEPTQIYNDYKNINGVKFIKELIYDEFNSEEYVVTKKTFVSPNKYSHNESITIPAEIFEKEEGTFVFNIIEIYYSEKDNGYCTNSPYETNGILVDYEYVDDDTIRLIRP